MTGNCDPGPWGPDGGGTQIVICALMVLPLILFMVGAYMAATRSLKEDGE